jgi:hypothetical protein
MIEDCVWSLVKHASFGAAQVAELDLKLNLNAAFKNNHPPHEKAFVLFWNDLSAR